MSIHVNAGSALTHLRSMLDEHTNLYQKSMEQLGSGTKFTSTADDPIDVCNSAKLAVKIDVNKQADSNIQLGKDMLNMATDSQMDVSSNISKISELCMQISNGTYSTNDKDDILKEIRVRLAYIDSVADSTNFNNVKFMDGSASSLFLQIGSTSSSTMAVGDALIDTHTVALGIDLPAAVNGSNWTAASIATYMNNLNAAVSTLTNTNAKLGGYINRLDFVSGTLTNMNENLTENKSIISDADTAEVSADMVRYQVLQQASVGILAQANQVPTMALTLLNNIK